MPANKRAPGALVAARGCSGRLCSLWAQFAVAQIIYKRDPGPEIAGNWRMSVDPEHFPPSHFDRRSDLKGRHKQEKHLMRRRAIPLLFATLLGLFGFLGSAHATLIGDTITDTEIFGTTVVQVNGPSVVPATFSIRAGPAASIAVGGNTITYSFLIDGVYTPVSFNGSVFDLSAPFSEATIDASSTTVPGVSNANVSISGGDLFVNLSGIRFFTGQEIVINVSTAVPEPSSLALLVAGLLSLGMLARAVRN